MASKQRSTMTMANDEATNVNRRFAVGPDRLALADREDAAKRQQILIIDDDKKFSRLLQEYLRPFGFDGRKAHDGLEGVRKLSEEHFDALVLDLMLPGIDGIEVLRRLGPERHV